MINKANPLYKINEGDQETDRSNYETDTKTILNPSVIIRKLSSTKFKEDTIDSHNKSFFSSEKSKLDNISEKNTNFTKLDENSKNLMLSKDLIVDSIFFNNSNNIEKSNRDSESISSSEESFDLQINSSDETIDLKERNDSDKY